MTDETVRAQFPNELAGDSSTTNNSDVTSEETESPNVTTITADRTPRTTFNLQDLAERSPRSTKRKNVSQPYGGKNARGLQGVDGVRTRSQDKEDNSSVRTRSQDKEKDSAPAPSRKISAGKGGKKIS